VIDEDAAEHRGSHGEEMNFALPLDPFAVDQAQIGLVDEGRWSTNVIKRSLHTVTDRLPFYTGVLPISSPRLAGGQESGRRRQSMQGSA
jgi:hypothetical protein